MRIIPGSGALSAGELGPCAVGIGIFDGVHRGHQTLLGRVTALAQAAGIESVAYTFNPHPARVLNPELAPRLIEPVEKRLEGIDNLGIDTAVVEPFTREFADRSAEAYVVETLVGLMGTRHLVVGADFTFGARQQGNVSLLRRLGEAHGFEVHPVDPVRVDGIVVSSTKIREFVRNGRVRGAAMLLGRPMVLSGVAVRGAERGTKLGFPTANVQARNDLTPAPGVYVGSASGDFGTHDAVINVGFNPTFSDTTEIKVEAHMLDYEGGDLYGQRIAVSFLQRLRDEKRFVSVEALQGQIRADVVEARKRLAAGIQP